MLVYDIGFINTDGKHDETQLDIEEYNTMEQEVIELINLILSLREEMGIKEITDITYVGDEEYLEDLEED